MKKSIKNYEYTDDFESVDAIHEALKNKQYEDAVPHIVNLKKEIKKINFPHNKSTYSRHILSKKDGYWLLLIEWDEDVSTCIHGHPEQSFVYLIDGSLEVKSFETEPLVLIDKKPLHVDEYIFHDQSNHSFDDKFDNGVHQIHSKTRSLSLHFYSDDPSKGVVFEQNKKSESGLYTL